MPFKINISNKEGKTFKLETEAEGLKGKELGDKIPGDLVSPDLAGYELEITGTSDKSGFTSLKEVEGIRTKKVLLSYGKAMHMKPKGEKKKGTSPPGLRKRKTVRGRTISGAISQINTKVLKDGAKPLTEIFKDQVKSPEAPATETTEAPKEPNKEPEKVPEDSQAKELSPEDEKKVEAKEKEAAQPEEPDSKPIPEETKPEQENESPTSPKQSEDSSAKEKKE